MNPTSSSVHTPGVDYHATPVRLHYEDLSEAVRRAADVALGSPVVGSAAPVTSGFTRAYVGRVHLRDGRQAFLKATGPDLPVPVRALRREAQILTALGDRIPSVPLIGAGEADDGGQVLALDWIDGHLPGHPWSDNEIALVRGACESVATVPSSTLDGLAPSRLTADLLGDEKLQAALAEGLAMPTSMARLPGWLPARIDEVLRVARQAETLLVGDHLTHFDLRPDNLLIGRAAGEGSDRAYVLDWNWVTLGPAWCDWVGLVPSIHDQGYSLGGCSTRRRCRVTRTRRPLTRSSRCSASTCSAAWTMTRRGEPRWHYAPTRGTTRGSSWTPWPTTGAGCDRSTLRCPACGTTL